MKPKSSKLKLRSNRKNIPLSIEDHPVEFVVGKEVVTESQEIQKVKPPKKQLPEVLEQYKWKPGQTGNPHGRNPDWVKSIAKRFAQLKVGKVLDSKELEKLKKLGLDEADVTVLESIIIDWATSRNPVKQQMYIERIAGKVPNININAEISAQLVAKFKSKFTDAELERIASGEDALEILLEKIPDVDGSRIIDAETEDV